MPRSALTFSSPLCGESGVSRTSHAPWGDPGGGGFLGASYAPYGLVSKYDPGHKAEWAQSPAERMNAAKRRAPKDAKPEPVVLEEKLNITD